MTKDQIAFLEQIATSPDSKKWKSIFETHIEAIKDKVIDEKLSPASGKAAIDEIRALINTITVLDQKPINASKNPAI